MKKLTAGILASLIGLVSANSAEAAVASTKYVNDGLATKQDTLTPTNFVAPTEAGDFITGFTVDKGTVTFTSGKLPAAAVVDATLSETSTNAIQNQAVAKKIAEMALTTDGQSGVIKTVKQTAGKVEVTSGTVAEADIADNAVTSAKIADSAVTSAKIANGTIVDDDIANVAMGKVTGLDTALNAKQDTLTQAANAGEGIKIENGKISADVTTAEFETKQNKLVADNQGDNVQLTFDAQGNLLKISATDTTYSTGTASAEGLTKLYATTGTAEDGTMTQKAITDELGTKQGNLTAGNGITLDAAGNIAAKAGTGITIDANGISADNQLNAVTGEAEDGLQVLTRKNCVNGVCEYVWESIDRTFGD